MNELNETAVASRRNPLSKQMEQKKKSELKQFKSSAHIPDQVYGLAVGPLDAPSYFYVGITNDPTGRWQQHRLGIANPLDFKDAYVFAREHHFKDTCRLIVLDETAEFTEAEWVNILTEQGHQLTNVSGAVDSKRKKKLTTEAKAENVATRRRVSDGMAAWMDEAYGKGNWAA